MSGVNECVQHPLTPHHVPAIGGRTAMADRYSIEETWKPVVGWSHYHVSDIGRVRCADGKIQASCLNSNGYAVVSLSRPRRSCRVHRLVAQAFIPNPNDLPQVNHLDGVKTNNTLANLEWTTATGNRKHAWDMGLRTRAMLPNYRGEAHPTSILTEADVHRIRRASANGETTRGLARRLGINRMTVKDVLRGKTWKHVPVLPPLPDLGERKT